MDKKSEKRTKDIIRLIKTKRSNYWMKKREENSIRLFKSAARRVPAYKDFLKKNKLNFKTINNWKDFQSVPYINKANYLSIYPIKDLCWDGNLSKPAVFTATSGSTGESVYFLREKQLDWQYSIILDSFLADGFKRNSKPTLVIICFGMGLWIGGLITYKAFEIASQRNNFPLSIITPGINKKEIFNALKNLAPQFKQIIFAGYPPFIKDIVDEAVDNGINLKRFNIRLLFAAEAISEEFRDYISRKAGIQDVYKDIISIYGSADIGAMAYETLASTLIRRIARRDKKLFSDIFSPINKTPTLAQFNPLFINFEEINGELLLTGDSAMPLVRYAIGDHGGVFSFSNINNKLKKYDISLKKELKVVGINSQINELPFVYVYERIDLSTTFYGLWIYPEWIKPALFEEPLCELLTGKFTLLTKYDEFKNQYLEINLELKKGKKYSKQLNKLSLQEIVKSLRAHSSEYGEIYNHIKNRALPILKFWPAEDPLYFLPGAKQKWVKRSEAAFNL